MSAALHPLQIRALEVRARFFPHIPTRITRPIARRIPPPPVVEALDPARPLHGVMKAVMIQTGVSRVDLESPRRDWRVLRPRQIFCWLAKRYTPASFPQIARMIGGRDHTTVLHAVSRVQVVADVSCPLTDTAEAWVAHLMGVVWPDYDENARRRQAPEPFTALSPRIVFALEQSSDGLTSFEVTEAISADGHGPAKLNSVSACLYDLRQANLVRLLGYRNRRAVWGLVGRPAQ